MDDTQISVIENHTIVHQAQEEIEPFSTAYLPFEQDSVRTTFLCTSPERQQTTSEPFPFDLTVPTPHELTPNDDSPLTLGEPLNSFEGSELPTFSPHDESILMKDAVKDWEHVGEGANEGFMGNSPKLDVDPSFLLDVSSDMLPVSYTPAVVTQQFRADLSGFSLSQPKDVNDMMTTQAPNALEMKELEVPQSVGEFQKEGLLEYHDTSGQLLQSAMHFTANRTKYGSSLTGQQQNDVVPTQGYPHAYFTHAGMHSGPQSLSTGAATSSGCIGKTGNLTRKTGPARSTGFGKQGKPEGVEKGGVGFGGQRGGKRRKANTKNNGSGSSSKNGKKGQKGTGSASKIGKRINQTAIGLSEEELRKLRRVKNRESVEKCRTKQRLRMEALQVEQKCLMSECALIKETLGKVQYALRETYQYEHLFGMRDDLRNRVRSALAMETNAINDQVANGA